MSRDPIAEILAGRPGRYDTAPIEVTAHAVARTNERHLHRLDPELAKRDLYRLLEGGVITREPPPWVALKGVRHRERVVAWLSIEGLAWPLYADRSSKADCLVLGTCLPARPVEVGASVRILRGGSQRERDGD